MERFPAGTLLDLFAATETVCDDQRIGRRCADSRQEFKLSDGK
jgi:hypothetical protein